jgi:hypothetical protein
MQSATRPMPTFQNVALKNSNDQVQLDENVYQWMTTDTHLKSMDFVNNLRKHSSGCVVFQKTRRLEKGKYETETIYLHKMIAEKFLPKPKTTENLLAGLKSNSKLDYSVENLAWRSRAEASRLRKTTGKSGFIGVYQESRRYRAVISHNGAPIHIGMYDTAEEAAAAYNKLSTQLYGKDAKLNTL